MGGGGGGVVCWRSARAGACGCTVAPAGFLCSCLQFWRVCEHSRAQAQGAPGHRVHGVGIWFFGRACGDCSSCARMAHQVVTAALLAQLTVAGQHGTEIQRVGMQVLAAMDERARFRNYPQARLAPLRGERACVDEVHEARRSSRCCRRRRTGLPKRYSRRMRAPAPRLPARRLRRRSASGSTGLCSWSPRWRPRIRQERSGGGDDRCLGLGCAGQPRRLR